MARYIDVEPLEVVSYESASEDFDNGVKYILEKIDALPTANVVEAKAIYQLKWERDTAIKQLQSYGVGLGEKKELAEVKHGEWKKHFSYGCWHYDCPFCDDGFATTEDFIINQLPRYCSNCGAKMDKRSDAE